MSTFVHHWRSVNDKQASDNLIACSDGKSTAFSTILRCRAKAPPQTIVAVKSYDNI